MLPVTPFIPFCPPRLVLVPVNVKFMPVPVLGFQGDSAIQPRPTPAQKAQVAYTASAGPLACLPDSGCLRTAARDNRAAGQSGAASALEAASLQPGAADSFRPPASEPAAPEQSLRDQAREAASDHLRHGFKAILNVVSAPAGSSSADRWAALRKSMATAYLLGLPVSPEVAIKMPIVEGWTPQEVFGCSAKQLVALMQSLKSRALAELALDTIPHGDEHDEVAQAACDFTEYVDECIDNVDDMRRVDGSRRRQLSSATMALIARAVPVEQPD